MRGRGKTEPTRTTRRLKSWERGSGTPEGGPKEGGRPEKGCTLPPAAGPGRRGGGGPDGPGGGGAAPGGGERPAPRRGERGGCRGERGERRVAGGERGGGRKAHWSVGPGLG